MELIFANDETTVCGLIKFYTHVAVNHLESSDHGAGWIRLRGNVIGIGWKGRVNSVA